MQRKSYFYGMKNILIKNKKVRILIALIIVVAALFFTLYPKFRISGSLDEVAVADSAGVEEIVFKYGIPVDEYDVMYGIVQPNRNLSYILSSHGVSLRSVHEISEKAKDVFDVRKIRSGQAYAVFSEPDSTHAVRYFVYEENPRTYVVFDLLGDKGVC